MRPILLGTICLALALSAPLPACGGSGGNPNTQTPTEDTHTSAAPTVTAIDISAYHVRFSIPSPWEAKESANGPEAKGAISYAVKDPGRISDENVEEGFYLGVLPARHRLPYDLAPEARDATLASMAQQWGPLGISKVELAGTRSIGGSTGLEVRVRRVGHLEQAAWVQFDDGVALYLLGGAYYPTVSYDEQRELFATILDSVERY